MKKRMISLACAFLLMINVCGAAAAGITPRASDYFSCTAVYATAMGGGKVLVEFDIDATHTMLEVGATDVYIYEQQSNGDYENVYTFTSDEYYSDMMDTNSAFGNGEVTYQGISGRKYFATVAVYARDSKGSETRYYDTYVVTA
mgnify:CR=1 FL=1